AAPFARTTMAIRREIQTARLDPALADGQPVFSAAHKKPMTAGDLTAAAPATAAAALPTQTPAHGRAPAPRARSLVLGTLLAGEARTVVASRRPGTVRRTTASSS